jgi:predicted ABC-type transport system involved in lysophospholipase L1 biosynthesis ATPase subunit
MDMLCALNRENGQTFVVVTHATGVSARAGRVITMHDGAITSDAPQGVAQVYRSTVPRV